MSIKQEIFLSHYPQLKSAILLNHDIVSHYVISDYWNKVSKHNIANFYQFVSELFHLASLQAPQTIKEFFQHPEIKLSYDEIQPTHCLYILAKGSFNGIDYEVKATSEHKYHKTHYILDSV